MKKLLLLFIIILQFREMTNAQNPKRELRAAWISTVYGIDWPSASDAPATQRTKLISILDKLKDVGINAVYFQVRTTADALYNSSLVPWSHWLTGTYGQNPGWDPLAFAIDEAHKRGLEIHAWLNPYRAAISSSYATTYATNHVARTHPDWLLTSGTTKYLNPGIAGVRSHIVDVIEEIITKYDIDGIHFDDYFYLSGISDADDNAQFTSDPRGFTSRANWRRDNVTLMIRGVGEKIKALKPWIKFGISPSGIYRNFTVPNVSPTTNTTGSEHYSVQYADTKYWMEQGLIDYLIPQVYWAFSQSTANAKFNYISDYWNRQNFARHLYIGLATYRVDPADGSAWSSTISLNEIKNQISYLRTNTPNIMGTAHFTSHDLISTKTGVKEAMDLVRQLYNTPALLPTMTWIDNVPPAEPTDLTPSLASGKTKLTWTAPASTSIELQKVKRYAIYRSTSPSVDFNNSTNLIAVISSENTTYTDNSVSPGQGTAYYYAVTSLDRISNESVASNIVPDAVTLPVQLIAFTAKKNGNRVKIEWSTANETNSDYFLVEKAGTDGIFGFLDKKPSVKTNTKEISTYFTWDYKPINGINYYKLTQFDNDGKASTPETAVLNFSELIVVDAKAFPNPTRRDINFNLENFTGKSIKTKLISLYGQIVHEEEFNTAFGVSKFQLNLKKELPKGQYILTLVDHDFKKHIKLIVL